MKMSSNIQERFPRLTRYVREQMPRLVSDPRIAHEMSELTGLDVAKLKEAMQWGNEPSVLVVDLSGEGAAGMFRRAHPNQIEIDEGYVKRYEDNEEPTGYFEQSARQTESNTVPWAGVILLHELVHWADFKADRKITDPGGFYHDLGSKWELLAFGVASDLLKDRKDVH